MMWAQVIVVRFWAANFANMFYKSGENNDNGFGVFCAVLVVIGLSALFYFAGSFDTLLPSVWEAN